MSDIILNFLNFTYPILSIAVIEIVSPLTKSNFVCQSGKETRTFTFS